MNTDTILVVDDESMNLSVISEFLNLYGFNVLVAQDGHSAIQIAQNAIPLPDLILLDVMMPNINGFQTCEILKQNDITKDIPVIFLTALSQTENKVKGFESGGVDYITKPFQHEEILVRINTHLTIQKQKKELELRNQFIQKTFGRYVSEEIVKQLLETPEGLQLGGEIRKVTIMMSDLRGFTAICESLPPEDVLRVINTYLEFMTPKIIKYQGTINEIIGDGMMVMFGAPVQNEDDAIRAVACAIEMQLSMVDVNNEIKSQGMPEVAMGIGIHTGEVIAGNIGSKKRTKYGVVGSNVNLTSRIESFTIGGQIFISESTAKECGDILEYYDTINISPKGSRHPITIYDVKGIGEQYNLKLPNRTEMTLKCLSHPLQIKYNILVGKHASGEWYNGKMISLAPSMGVIDVENAQLKRFTNVRLILFDRNGLEVTSNVYAKVIKNHLDIPNHFTIYFTGMPQHVTFFITALLTYETRKNEKCLL